MSDDAHVPRRAELWLKLRLGAQDRVHVLSRQWIRPTADGSDCEVLLTCQAELGQEVVLVTPQVTRLRYSIQHFEATKGLREGKSAPVPDASQAIGCGFELILSASGPLVIPAKGHSLADEQSSWLHTVSENLRACWPVPPADIEARSTWQSTPTVDERLPPGAVAANQGVVYEVEAMQHDTAQILARFSIKMRLKASSTRSANQGVVTGEAKAKLDRRHGLLSAEHGARMELPRWLGNTHQLQRSRTRVRRID